MLGLAVVTTARSDQIGAPPVDSVFMPLFFTADDQLADSDGNPYDDTALLSCPCLALIGWDERDSTVLESIRNRLIDIKAAIIPDIVILEDEPSWDSMLVGIAHCMERFVLLQARLIGQQTADLLTLRRAHDSLQESFARLESYFVERAVPALEEAFACEPSASLPLADLRVTRGRQGLRQYLPISTKNLGAISLHVAESDANASGDFLAELWVPELNRRLASWRIPIAFLQRGWITLGLDRTAGGLAKSAHLRLSVDGDPGRGRLSLGQVHPLPLYQLSRDAGEPVTARSLSFRLFVALPGIRLAHDELTFLPDHVLSGPRVPPSSLNRLQIPTATLRNPKVLLPSAEFAEDFALVQLSETEGTVMVHPGRSQPTIALFENSLPPGTRSVSGDIFIDNAAAGIVGFRIGIVEGPLDDRDHVLALSTHGSGAFVHLTDWSFIGPDRRQSLALQLGKPVGEAGAAILLATRVPDGGSSDFAWAKFARLHFETA